jgi:hypothetical protein
VQLERYMVTSIVEVWRAVLMKHSRQSQSGSVTVYEHRRQVLQGVQRSGICDIDRVESATDFKQSPRSAEAAAVYATWQAEEILQEC